MGTDSCHDTSASRLRLCRARAHAHERRATARAAGHTHASRCGVAAAGAWTRSWRSSQRMRTRSQRSAVPSPGAGARPVRPHLHDHPPALAWLGHKLHTGGIESRCVCVRACVYGCVCVFVCVSVLGVCSRGWCEAHTSRRCGITAATCAAQPWALLAGAKPWTPLRQASRHAPVDDELQRGQRARDAAGRRARAQPRDGAHLLARRQRASSRRQCRCGHRL
jgi:hypothetical protein